MKGLDEALAEHQSSYTKQVSKICHYISVPLFFLAVLIFLGWIHIMIPGILDTTLAWLTSIALVVYYAKSNWKLGIGIAFAFLILNMISRLIALPGPSLFGLGFLLVVVVLAFALEVVADSTEGRKPNPKHYMCAFVGAPLGIMRDLYEILSLDKLFVQAKAAKKTQDKEKKDN